ncbi:MAG TPA: nuclease-related domain-containing protein [Acidimicrobiales bacterium]|nr:nuclease-related domain-containing protein [Acidimicrobiales bacterium]
MSTPTSGRGVSEPTARRRWPRRLAKLVKKDARWRVLHAIPVGENGSDIDHLVVGPGGVFTLNAKHHPDAKLWIGGDTFRVNGFPHPYVRNSRFEARRAAQLLTLAAGLPVAVTGVVVPVGAVALTIKRQPRDVQVVNRMALTD